MPKTWGNECDAWSFDGSLEAIEGQEPLRQRFHRLGRRPGADVRPPDGDVVDTTPRIRTRSPGRVLREMAEQRVAMGLGPARSRQLQTAPPSFRWSPSSAAPPPRWSRMLAVRDVLAASEHGFPRVQIFEVSLIGELIQLDESADRDRKAPLARGLLGRAAQRRRSGMEGTDADAPR